MIDSRSWPSCPCCPSQLLSYTPPEQTLCSGLWPSHVLVEKHSQWPGLGWRSSDVGRSLGASLVREGFLEEEGLRGQVMSDL